LPPSIHPRVCELPTRLAVLCLALASGAIALSASPQTGHQSAPTTPLAVSEFVGELDRVLVVLARAEPRDLVDLRDNIPANWRVRSGDEAVEVPAAWLRRALEEARRDPSTWPARRRDITARLSGTRAEAVALEESPAGAELPSARATLGSVLAEKEFRKHAGAGAVARLRRAITDFFIRLWQQLGGERLGRRTTAIVFAWAAGIAALFTFTWWVVRALVTTRAGGRLALTVPPAARQSARAWALRAAAARDDREAARCAYHAAVVRLEEEGAWRADDTRTPREHVRMLPAGHKRRSLFADVARRFEEIWFGGRAGSSDDTRELLSRLRELGCLPGE
jgi:hypothetical protein